MGPAVQADPPIALLTGRATSAYTALERVVPLVGWQAVSTAIHRSSIRRTRCKPRGNPALAGREHVNHAPFTITTRSASASTLSSMFDA